jgi:hypothetical protein
MDEEGEESEETQIKKMFNTINPWTYYICTLSLYGLQIAGSIAIADVQTIFDFMSAFSVSAI